MTVFNGMPASELGDVEWRKSRRSNSQGNCVQFARLEGGQVAIRDSKHPDGPVLVFADDEIRQFVNALKIGRHDALISVG